MNHQSSPYAGAQRSTISQASCGHRRDAGEGDRRHGDRQQQRVAWGGRRGGGPADAESPRDVPGDRVDVAALALGAAAGVQPGVAQPGLDVDGRAQLVAEQREGRVAEREGGVEGDRRTATAGSEPSSRRSRWPTPRLYAATASTPPVSGEPVEVHSRM